VTRENDSLKVDAHVEPLENGIVGFRALLRQPLLTRRRRDTSAFSRLGPQQVRAAADLGRAHAEGLVVESSHTDLQEGLSWSIARLLALLPDPGPGAASVRSFGPADALMGGLGAVAVGRFDSASVMSNGTPGVLSDVLRQWNPLDAFGTVPEPSVSLAAMLDRLREPSAGLVRLGRAGSAAPSKLDTYATWLKAWHHFDTGESEEGAEALERLLELGKGGGLAWALPGRVEEDLILTAILPSTIVFGALGAQADASVGRLRLAPRLPDAWGSVTIRNLRMGSARVTLAYRSDANNHVFSIEQTQGAVPINLVFEPSVRVPEIGEARVDGETVDLDRIAMGPRVGVRLQLPLDGRREVTLEART